MSNRFELLNEVQACLWRSPADVPEVEVRYAEIIESFLSYEDALLAAKKLLATVHAQPTFADVRPIEECAKCGADFDTRNSHHTLVISEESGDQTNPQIVQVWYVARFCCGCGNFEGGLLR